MSEMSLDGDDEIQRNADIRQRTNNRKQASVELEHSNPKDAWQDMYITTAPSLFLGLGARIFINKFVYHYDSSTIPDFVFLGLWQGTALYYLLMRQVEFAWAASVGILGRLLIDFAQNWDTSKCACTLLGVALGVLVTDIASQFLEDDTGRPAIFGGTVGSPNPDHHYRRRPSRRLVQFSRSNSLVEPVKDKGKETARDTGRDRERGKRERHKDAKLEDFKKMRDWESRSIITADSITSSDLIHPKSKMTPLQREVANLRAKASLADTERRRFKEEKKWALSQGNPARAEQMGWQVKRYAALVDSFHKEADAKLLEGALLSFAFVTVYNASSSLASGLKPIERSKSYPTPVRPTATKAYTDIVPPAPAPTVVSVEFPRKRRSFSALKPSVRVSSREWVVEALQKYV